MWITHTIATTKCAAYSACKPRSLGENAVENPKHPDGTWGIAGGECYAGVDSGATCVSVNESRTIKYRLSTIGGESSEKEAAYVIAPKTANLTINGVEYSEGKTDCAVSSSDKALTARVKLTNASAIGADKVAYVLVNVGTTNLNADVSVTDSVDTGIVFKGTGDDAPVSAGGGGYPGGNSATPADKCTVKLTAFKVGEAATGEIECSLNISEYLEPIPIGKTISIAKGAWHCDTWKSSLY